MTINQVQYPLLSQINAPEDLRALPRDTLAQVAEELRDYLINTIARCGGHFAAGLGTVELTVALHYLYQTPSDKGNQLSRPALPPNRRGFRR